MSGPDEPEVEGDDEAEGEPLTFVVAAAQARERLDRVVSLLVEGTTRSQVQRWIEDGRVEIDGETARASTKARAGASIVVRRPPPQPSEAIPEPIPLSIVFEDPHLVVIDKPAGLVVHPAAGHPSGTLVNGLVHRYGGLSGEARRPGIVHRIDRDTSGLLVVARTDAAREGLAALFARHDIERRYLAVVLGVLSEARTFDSLHGRHPTDRKRFSGRVTRGKRAVTHVEPLEDLGEATLVRCRLETGRTHQIRVHLSEAGHPILADAMYGRTPSDARLARASALAGRQALHAAVLGFVHPVTGERLRFESPIPADLAGALTFLRKG